MVPRNSITVSCRCSRNCSSSSLTLLERQSRFGDKPPKFQVVCPQNGTAVLNGLTLVGLPFVTAQTAWQASTSMSPMHIVLIQQINDDEQTQSRETTSKNSYYYYYFSCHPTTCSMTLNIDHSRHSWKQKSLETKETYAQGLSTFYVYCAPRSQTPPPVRTYFRGGHSLTINCMPRWDTRTNAWGNNSLGWSPQPWRRGLVLFQCTAFLSRVEASDTSVYLFTVGEPNNSGGGAGRAGRAWPPPPRTGYNPRRYISLAINFKVSLRT